MPINFPTSPSIGQSYTYNNTIWLWNGTAWGIATSGTFSKLDSIAASFNGVNTAFTLAVGGTSVTPATAQNLIISIDGVLQEPQVAYTVSNSTITFTEAPPSGASFFGIQLGSVGSTVTLSDGTVTTAKLQDSAVTSAKIQDGAVTSAKLSNTGVSAATYGNATIVPVFTVDTAGRIISASNTTISAGISTGKAIAMALVFGG